MPTRFSARWVLPVTAAPIENGALLAGDGGRILEVGTDAAVPWPEGARVVDLGHAALLPGLVNVHAHPELTAMRGLLEDLPFHEWIPALMRAKLGAALTYEEYVACARAGCREALRAGITTVGATEDSGASLDALRALGLRGVVYRELFGPAPAQAEEALAAVQTRVDEMRSRATDLVGVGISPHAPYTVSDRLFRLAAAWACAEKLPVAIHAAESLGERLLVSEGAGPFADGLRRRGIDTPVRAGSTIALLEQLGVLATRPLLIHCVQLVDDDVSSIARAGAAVAHCPAANARLGHGIAPVLQLQQAGVVVGLGSDSVAANNRMDMLEEARLAQMLQRAGRQSPVALGAAELLRMATLDGARALGLDNRVGSLEPGKDADLCAVSLDALHVQPVHDPVAALFLAARGTDVVLTVVRGHIIYGNDAARSEDEGDAAILTGIAERMRRAMHAGPAYA